MACTSWRLCFEDWHGVWCNVMLAYGSSIVLLGPWIQIRYLSWQRVSHTHPKWCSTPPPPIYHPAPTFSKSQSVGSFKATIVTHAPDLLLYSCSQPSGHLWPSWQSNPTVFETVIFDAAARARPCCCMLLTTCPRPSGMSAQQCYAEGDSLPML